MLGAHSPEECEDYYAWGKANAIDKYTEHLHVYIARKPLNDDTTIAYCQGVRLPIKEEITELVDKCTTEYINQKGVFGISVTEPYGNSSFLLQ